MESTATTSSTANSVPPFLGKLYDLVEDSSTNDVVSWSDDNNSFVVWKVAELSRDLLPKYFKHSNFSSFVRQLNTYGFRKVDPDHYEFANEGFLRGQKHLLKGISRRKSAQVHGQQQPRLQSSAGACVEVGKFGLEEEVEILKRDKNILMQELIRVRQQQQTTENQLQTVGQRVQVMEQRQQQLMSFLAKAMNSPGFLSQLVQPQNESNSRISGGNKKRRLPRQDEENMNGSQIIKFQPFMHETAKAMLQKLSKINGSSGVDQSKNNGSQFMVDNVSSSNALDNGSSTSQISGVTFSEIPPVSGQSCASTDYPVSCASTAISGMTVNNSKAGSVSHDVIEPQGTTPVGNPGPNDIMSETEKSLLDASLFCPDVDMDMDILADGISKSPADEDAFWEQFLAANPLTEDTDEINPNFLEDGLTNEQPLLPVNENGWSKSQHLDNLTEQMGLLVSEKRRP